MTKSSLDLAVQRFKALGHPARMRLALALRSGELCVCQMIAVLELAASTVSAHLKELRRAGLLVEGKQGRWVFYALSPEGAILLASVAPEVGLDEQILADSEVVVRLRGIDPEELCRTGSDRVKRERDRSLERG